MSTYPSFPLSPPETPENLPKQTMSSLEATIPLTMQPSKEERKAFILSIYHDILAIYDREFRLNWHSNMLSETAVIAQAVEYIQSTHPGSHLEEATVRTIYQMKRPKTSVVPLPELRRALDRELYDFIIARFDQFQKQTAVGIPSDVEAIPRIWAEIRETLDVHIMHMEITHVIVKEGRTQDHIYLPNPGLNINMSLSRWMSEELTRRAMESEKQKPLLFENLNEELKRDMRELMKRWGEVRQNDFWLRFVFIEMGGVLGFDMALYPGHVTIDQEKYLAIRGLPARNTGNLTPWGAGRGGLA
jgi:hypothetical protein